jgi:bacterioferritin-associated ferredoxin
MFVCMCAAVTEAEVHDCIAGGARTVEEVAEVSFACSGCGGCRESIEAMLAASHLGRRVARFCALARSA